MLLFIEKVNRTYLNECKLNCKSLGDFLYVRDNLISTTVLPFQQNATLRKASKTPIICLKNSNLHLRKVQQKLKIFSSAKYSASKWEFTDSGKKV